MEAHNFGGFEEIYNIPMIVWGPSAGVVVGASIAARVGLHDLNPTLLEIYGLLAAVRAEGQSEMGGADSSSFLSLLRAPEVEAPNFQHGYAEYFGTRFPLCQRILWDGDMKLVFNGFDCESSALCVP